MVKHIVVWKLKETDSEIKQQHAEKIKEIIEALVGVVPGLISAEVGIDYNNNDYDVVLYSELQSRQALLDYAVHPEHEKVGKFIGSVTCGRACVDFEV